MIEVPIVVVIFLFVFASYGMVSLGIDLLYGYKRGDKG